MYELMRKAHYSVVHMPRQRKRYMMMLLDAICLPLCLWFSYALRLSDWWPEIYMSAHWFLFPFISVVGVFVFATSRIYRTILRYIGSTAMLQITKAVVILTLLLMSMGLIVSSPIIPRSVPIIFCLVTLIYVGSTRFFYRHYYHWIFHNILPNETVAIYGAGKAGAQIVATISDSTEYKAVAFLDDDPNLWGSVVQGLRVFSPDDLGYLEVKYNIKRVLLAIPSASSEERRSAIEKLAAKHLKILTVPSLSEIVEGKAQVANLRAVEIEDLLGREPVPPRHDLLDTSIRDQNILVTGAGGSIGSELCRQILLNAPKRLVLFERNEFNLYAISQELTEEIDRQGYDIELYSILGSVTDPVRLGMVVSKFDIDTFYHAAAFKHVPLVEQNVFAGIHNNILGTRIACDLSAKHGVKRFVLISTDKAVRPTNVMGATKRVAELIVQTMAASNCGTIFSMVRFGNVLGSSGSVVPLFRRQIAQGGPLTVTHKDITRYFMTINEAALLVIQAGSMAEGGDVFVLDMGKEIKIYEMARQMILLSGLEVRDEAHPDGDVEIVISGLRPAEKIHEELLIGDNNVLQTQHPRIMHAQEDRLDAAELDRYLHLLKEANQTYDVTRAISLLGEMVQGYQPADQCSDFLARQDQTAASIPAVPRAHEATL